jgi:hypothetical protein
MESPGNITQKAGRTFESQSLQLILSPGAPFPSANTIKHRIDEIDTEYPFYGSRRITGSFEEKDSREPQNHSALHAGNGQASIYPQSNLGRRTGNIESLLIDYGVFPLLIPTRFGV